MQRLTARFLLVLLLVGTFAPAALALAAPAPHACCMRKPMHGSSSHNSDLQASSDCCNHDHCRPLNHSGWVSVAPSSGSDQPISASGRLVVSSPAVNSLPDESHSGRAPPQFSIT